MRSLIPSGGFVTAAVIVLAIATTITAAAADPGPDTNAGLDTNAGPATETLEIVRLETQATTRAAIVYSLAIVVGLSTLSAAYAVGKVGAAALAAASEKPEILGRALAFVGLAEGIAIFGVLIGIILIFLITNI